MKVYVVLWHEDLYNGEIYSGKSGVFDSLDKAKKDLMEFVEEEIDSNDLKLSDFTFNEDETMAEVDDYKYLKVYIEEAMIKWD